jgi:FkbM family methyltransferase
MGFFRALAAKLTTLHGVTARAGHGRPVQTDSEIPLLPSRDDVFKELIGDGSTITAVDVGGANDLQPHWNRMRAACSFVVYEPNKEAFDELVQRQKATSIYDNFLYLNVGLAEHAGRRDFHVTNIQSGSSLKSVNKNGISSFNNSTYFFPMNVESIVVNSLAASLDEIGVGTIDIIKLDTQGTELEILRGLGELRTDSLLAIELECGLLDDYEGDQTAFEDTLRYVRGKGFQLFDLRCNRFAGSAPRFDLAVIEAFFGNDLVKPPSAHRLSEVDAIFFRETRHFVRARPNTLSIRRFVALLCVYNFFMEAIAAVKLAAEENLIDDLTTESLLSRIKTLFDIEKAEFEQSALDQLDKTSYFWAQYMWVPVPST